MADAYGAMVFSHSENAEFDKQSIVSVLNKYQWENEGGEWLLTESGNIFYSKAQSQYPTVYMRQTALYFVETENGLLEKRPDAMQDNDWSNVAYEDVEIVPLALIKDELLPYVKSGWMQIACAANEKQRYVYMEQLKIYAEGKVVREHRFVGSGTDCREDFEEI